MPFRGSRPPGRFEEIDRWAGGVGWFAYPKEVMQRASHALRVNQPADSGAPPDVWVIDPLRAPGVDELLETMGSVVGVVVLLDRHGRDAVGFARRYDVPLYLPAWIDVDVPDDVGIVRIEDGLPGTEYDLLETVNLPGWHEAALYDGDTLVVADAVGTVDYFTTRGAEIGIHPMLRLLPPSSLRGLTPERVLTGHGTGIMSDGQRALENAVNRSRRDAPRLYFEALKSLVLRPFSGHD